MDIALLLVRLIGIGFAAHGAQKLFGWFGGHGLAGTGGFFEQIGFRPGHLFAAAAGFSEIAGGLLVAFGLFGPIGPMFMIAVMTTAALSVHAPNGFFAQNNGYELPLVYGVLALVLAFTGFGAYSLDAAFGLSTVWTPTLSWIFVGLGILGGLGNVATRRKAATSPSAGN
jgi:putative oxidoreductase